MTWLLYGIGAIALLLMIAAGIGSTLPREHIASRTIRFRKASAEEVFALVAGPQQWRKGSEKDPPSEVVESTRPTRHVTRISDPKLPFGGTWTWEIENLAEGCNVRLTEDGFVTAPLFRFISHYVMGHYATIDNYLQQLQAKLGD